MKYVMFVRQGQLVPIIFPDFINHKDVVNAVSHIFALSTAAPVTAGTCVIYCTSTEGKSTSTQLPSKSSDAQVINMYDYCHGMVDAPPTAEMIQMARLGFMAVMQQEGNLASVGVAKSLGPCTSYCGCMGDDPECPVHGNPNQG
jgi:hypothetical protein